MSARVRLARQALVYGWSVLSHSKITWLGWPYATRIFIPQYTTTTAMTTQAASRTLSTGESRIGLLSFAHPKQNLCDSIGTRQRHPGNGRTIAASATDVLVVNG